MLSVALCPANVCAINQGPTPNGSESEVDRRDDFTCTKFVARKAPIDMNSQGRAIRLRKEYRFDAKSVYIRTSGSSVVLFPKAAAWQGLIEACGKFSSDFMTNHEVLPVQERDC